MIPVPVGLRLFASFSCVLLLQLTAAAQTVMPAIAQYRAKAEGRYEIRNDNDYPVAVTAQVRGFSVDEYGDLEYAALEPWLKVDLDADSFMISPHQSHFVFYKAAIKGRNAWFTILNRVARSVVDRDEIRINLVFPHVVYVYQKEKLDKNDIEVSIAETHTNGEYILEVLNRTAKLGRVETVSTEGFEHDSVTGGFPVFPNARRRIRLEPGVPSRNASVKVAFQDGLLITVPFEKARSAGFQRTAPFGVNGNQDTDRSNFQLGDREYKSVTSRQVLEREMRAPSDGCDNGPVPQPFFEMDAHGHKPTPGSQRTESHEGTVALRYMDERRRDQ